MVPPLLKRGQDSNPADSAREPSPNALPLRIFFPPNAVAWPLPSSRQSDSSVAGRQAQSESQQRWLPSRESGWRGVWLAGRTQG